jgi:hypothetical protein
LSSAPRLFWLPSYRPLGVRGVQSGPGVLHNQPLLWTGPRRVHADFRYSVPRRVALPATERHPLFRLSIPVKDELISIHDVARQHGKRKQSVFKILRRLQITPTKQRSAAGRNQLVSYVTKDEHQRISRELVPLGIAADGEDGVAEALLPTEAGVFYLIQLEPELDPARFKLGFATTLAERLRHLRCSAPFAIVLKSWPCRLLWEKTAIESIAAGCEQLHTEVFRAVSMEEVIARCDRFFAMMPSLKDGAIRQAE